MITNNFHDSKSLISRANFPLLIGALMVSFGNMNTQLWTNITYWTSLFFFLATICGDQ